MRSSLWQALGIASKDKAMRLTLVDIVGKTAVFMVEITDRKSGRSLYKFEPLCFEKKNQREQMSVTIGLDVEVDVNAEGVADLLQEGQACEMDKLVKEQEQGESDEHVQQDR